jgi:hypothetical protein
MEEEHKHGPKFILDIEGVLKPWDKDTITTEEVITLGGWDPSLGAILIDKDNNERTLQPGEVVELKPGMGFSKKVRFRRGYDYGRADRKRIDASPTKIW